MVLKAAFAAVVIAAGFTASGASAAAIFKADRDIEGRALILIDGTLEAGDFEKFRALSQESEGAVVVLHGPTGDAISAMMLGQIIAEKGYDTVVPDGAYCPSSCALIWAAGASRYLASGATIGFGAYLDNNSSPREVATTYALIGHYLAFHGFSTSAVYLATQAPNGLVKLDRSNAERWGLEVAEPSSEWKQIIKSTLPPPPILLSPVRP